MAERLVEVSAADMCLRKSDGTLASWSARNQDNVLARRSDPVTSHVAADNYANRKAHDEALIFEVICAAGDAGMTYREIAAKLGWVEAVRVARRLSAMPVITRTLKPDAKTDDDFIERAGCAVWRAK